MDLDDQQQFQICAVYSFGPVLEIRCTRCYRWSAHIDGPRTLAAVNQRAEAHAQDCHVPARGAPAPGMGR